MRLRELKNMQLALITDTHFGARSDSIPFDNFFRKFYEECFWPKIDELGIEYIFHLGDCFDRRKYVNFNTLKSCREYFFDEAKKRDIKIVMIVGNHDTFFKNTNDVNSPGLLLKDYSNIIAYSGPVDYSVGGCSILMLPWICADNYNDCMDAIKTTKSAVCFGHLELAGFSMMRGHECEDGYDPKLFTKFEVVCSGHFHHRHSKGNIIYLGNPYEMFWSDLEDPRGFHIFDTNSRDLEFIQNPFNMFTRYYYDDETNDISSVNTEQFANKHVKLVIVNKKDFFMFDKFMENLYKVNPLEVKILEDFSEFESEALDDEINLEDTLTLLSNYVDVIETDINKEKLKTVMKTLYVEAQHYGEV
jgi:DNA repair exonuclease SbcCD nuclease subunit